MRGRSADYSQHDLRVPLDNSPGRFESPKIRLSLNWAGVLVRCEEGTAEDTMRFAGRSPAVFREVSRALPSSHRGKEGGNLAQGTERTTEPAV